MKELNAAIYNMFILPKEGKELASALEMSQVMLRVLNCNVWKRCVTSYMKTCNKESSTVLIPAKVVLWRGKSKWIEN